MSTGAPPRRHKPTKMPCYPSFSWTTSMSTWKIIAHKFWFCPVFPTRGQFLSILPIYSLKICRYWCVATWWKDLHRSDNAHSCNDRHAIGSRSTRSRASIRWWTAMILRLAHVHCCKHPALVNWNQTFCSWDTRTIGKAAIKKSCSITSIHCIT